LKLFLFFFTTSGCAGRDPVTDPRSIDYTNATSGPMDQGSAVVSREFYFMTLSIFHTDCPVKARNNYDLIPDPLRYSHWHLVPLKPDVFAGDQGSVATERGALREDLLAVLTGLTSAMNIAQAL
jgi:hypothetical protein